ncbi:TspO/MBR family protein [Kitasatospora paranensis]|uniref:TspO/MBR family protein n=1 Tax=Kitasatospora paranensis TaxID=258053 RepID=UPI0031EB3BC4
MGRGPGPDRRVRPRSARSGGLLGVDLSLNAAWNWLCFQCRSPAAALAGSALLDLSNADLVRRAARTNPTAAALTPYAAWCAFATALNADIARRNLG